MARRYIADAEANNLLLKATTIHCLGLLDIDTKEELGFADQPGFRPISEGLALLSEADLVIGHNIVTYDFPLFERLRPGWKRPAKFVDTLILTRFCFPDVKTGDGLRVKRGTMPAALQGSHTLKAWGYRLGIAKGSYGASKAPSEAADVWANWSQEMQDYMMQDLRVTEALVDRIRKRGVPRIAHQLEHETTDLMTLVTVAGIPFNERLARQTYSDTAVKRLEYEGILQKEIGYVWVKNGGEFTPKSDNKAARAKGYTQGATFTKVKPILFEPGSRDQMARVLVNRYGWKPQTLTDGGKPKLDDEIIKTVPLPPEVKQAFTDYLTADKVCSFFVSKTKTKDGNQRGWLNQVKPDGPNGHGVIHAEYNCQGAVTGRATHSNPNIAQVPKVGSPFGAECRSLFEMPKGWVAVGSDLAGLELRMLAHELAPYDGGAYISVVLDGDVHTVNQHAAGIDTRNNAKTFIYGFLYGSGDYLTGINVGGVKDAAEADQLIAANRKLASRLNQRLAKDFGRNPSHIELATAIKGNLVKAQFTAGLPGFGQLKEELVLQARGFAKAKANPTARQSASPTFDEDWVKTDNGGLWFHRENEGGYISGLDGRRVPIRSEHSALNFALQGGGALVCKKWITETRRLCVDAGLNPGSVSDPWGGDYALNAWVHDEQLFSAKPHAADTVKKAALEAAPLAGKFFNLNVPIAADAKTGQSWKCVH